MTAAANDPDRAAALSPLARLRAVVAAGAWPWVWAAAALGAAVVAVPAREWEDWAEEGELQRPVSVAVEAAGDAEPTWDWPAWHPRAVRVRAFGAGAVRRR